MYLVACLLVRLCTFVVLAGLLTVHLPVCPPVCALLSPSSTARVRQDSETEAVVLYEGSFEGVPGTIALACRTGPFPTLAKLCARMPWRVCADAQGGGWQER